jgi:hypothetical protein
MMRHLALFCAAVLLSLSACSGSAGKSDCCKKAEEIKAQMPKCCATPSTSECCKKKSDCCKKAEELSAKLPDCCKKGESCCSK